MLSCLKRFLPLIILAFTLLSLVKQGLASDVTLAWDPSTSESAVGYKLYMGSQSRVYETSIVVGNQTQYTVKDMTAGIHYFAVTAMNAQGNESSFSNEVFTNAPPNALMLPRFDIGQSLSMPPHEIWTGIAIANMGSQAATVTFTASDSAGKVITDSGISNPASRELDPGAQLARLDTEIFGNGISQFNTGGSIELESAGSGIRGFYLIFDGRIDLMDGSNLSTEPLIDFVFTEIGAAGNTKIHVANNNAEAAEVTFNLMTADGEVLSSVTRGAAARGAIVADLFNDFFHAITPDPAGYVRVTADKGVHSFELIEQGSEAIAVLAGQEVVADRTFVYSPQYVIDDVYRTSLSVINMDSRGGNISLRLIGEDGFQIGVSRAAYLRPKGKLYIDDREYFGTSDPSIGYVEISSDGLKLAGSVVFSDVQRRTFSSGLPLVSELRTSVVFSHVASDDVYFTGIAVVNPNSTAATGKLEVYAADGGLVDSISEIIPAGHRRSKLLTEFLTSMAGKNQTSGYIRLTSDIPVAAFCLFGTHRLSVLSAIPGQ
jgi:hypothetical protein